MKKDLKQKIISAFENDTPDIKQKVINACEQQVQYAPIKVKENRRGRFSFLFFIK